MPGRFDWGVLLPEEIALMQELPWERILIRSGFYAQKVGEGFSFKAENKYNRDYFMKILRYLDMKECYDAKTGMFIPPQEVIHEKIWLEGVENLHSGAEGGLADFYHIELEIMDTFMAGIVRWINTAGLKTGFSCDGHGKIAPEIYAYDEEPQFFLQTVLDSFLFSVSDGQWRYKERKLINYEGNGDRRFNRRLMDEKKNFNRYWLLDAAEKIYLKQDFLRDMLTFLRRARYRVK